MPDPTNLVSAELSDQDQAEALSLLDRLKQKLPFLVSIPDKEKRYLLYPGLSGLDACRVIYDIVTKHRDRFPQEVVDAMPELARDLALANMLRPVVRGLKALTQALDDTISAARSDAYRNALEAYIYLKPLVKKVPGLSEELASVRSFFDRPRRTPKGDADE